MTQDSAASEHRLEIGLQAPHIGVHASPDYVRDFCQAAEHLGFDAVWTADHVAVPKQVSSLYTLGGKPSAVDGEALSTLLGENYEGSSTLLFVAGFTQRLRLGTSVSVLTIRNPVMNAKVLATLDALSGGRLMYGAGVGWLKEETEALQMPWDHRGRRADEHIQILRTIWEATDDWVSYEGDFYSFSEIDPRPKPSQIPSPPVLVGGHSERALRRAGELGNGWIASRLEPAELHELFARVKDYADAAGRDSSALRLHANADFSSIGDLRGQAVLQTKDRLTSMMSEARVEELAPEPIVERISQFQRQGVHHLKLSVRARSQAEEMEWIRFVGEEVLGELNSG
jgi:probable F420-dependent oxidoreductase